MSQDVKEIASIEKLPFKLFLNTVRQHYHNFKFKLL